VEESSVPKKASPKGFARVDSESTNSHGWLVRILRGTERRSRFFSDKTHGGKAKSKKKAEECYQAWVAEMEPPISTRDKITKRNSSGVVGVHLATESDPRYKDCRYVSYVASWMNEDRQRCNIRFLVNKYGKKNALALATIAREKKCADREKVIAMYEKAHGPLKMALKPSNAKLARKAEANSAPANEKKKSASKKVASKRAVKKQS
jgi:hypothetical protein